MKKIYGLLLITITAFCVLSCGNERKAKHVILFGLDGMASAYFNADEHPTIKAMMEDGCWTFKKRSVLPSSSADNWASMFMGVSPELHGYTTWGSKSPELEPRILNAHGIHPTMFSLLDEQRPDSEIGCISEWLTIKCLIDSLAVDYYDRATYSPDDMDKLCVMAEKYIKEKKPELFAICWDSPDGAGHNYGWGSPQYLDVIKLIDGYIGRVIQATKDAGIYDDTIFIVTADHGGINRGHGSISLNEMETPFIICGKNIRKGGEFQESMMQFDVAATIVRALGLTQPQEWIGRPMPVFE
ncbi:MAG: alkaline phosphatase [Alistipes sp.]|nr:alkaline phosphatase [Candidatus Minthomonas equi]